MHDPDLLERNTQDVVDDLREGRLVALTVRGCPDLGDDGTVALDRHLGELRRAGRRAHFDIGGDPDPEQLHVAALAACALPGAQRLVVGDAHGFVERVPIVAGVVGGTGERGERELVLRQEVPAPQLHGVDPQFVSCDVDDALQQLRRLGTARAAERADGRGIRRDHAHVELDLGDAIRALTHQSGEHREEHADAGIRARVLDELHSQAGDHAFAREAQLDVLHLAPRVTHRHEVLRAGLGPLHRPPEQLDDAAHDRVLGVHPDLRAEPASHGRDDHVDCGRLHSEQGGKSVAQRVGSLGRRPELQSTIALGLDDDAVRLHRDRRHPGIREPPTHHDLCIGQRGAVASEGHVHGDVAAVLREQQRRVGRGCENRVVHRRQRVVVDDDHLGRVHRLGAGPGDHHRDRLTDVTHGVLRGQLACEDVRDGHDGRERRKAEIGVRVDAHDARHVLRLGCVDTLDAGVRDRRADEDGVQQTGDRQVVEVAGLPGKDPRILDPADGGPDERMRSGRHGAGS